MDAGCRGRIEGCEAAVHGYLPVSLDLLVNGPAQLWVGSHGRQSETVKQGTDVKARPSHDQSNPAGGCNQAQDMPSLGCIALRGIDIIGRDQIDHVVARLSLFYAGRFGRADIHVAVDLSRIRRNNVGVPLVGQLQSECRFSYRRWTYQDND
jgi:hypothetical protein